MFALNGLSLLLVWVIENRRLNGTGLLLVGVFATGNALWGMWLAWRLMQPVTDGENR